MRTKQDGVEKVLMGITDMHQVRRVYRQRRARPISISKVDSPA
jgi:hypothetical protein